MSLPTNTNSSRSRWSAAADRPCRTRRHNSSRCSNSSPRQRTPSSSIAGACCGVVLAPTRSAWRNAGMSVATGTIPDYAHCGGSAPRSTRPASRIRRVCPLRAVSALPAWSAANRNSRQRCQPIGTGSKPRASGWCCRLMIDLMRNLHGATPTTEPFGDRLETFSSDYAWQSANSTGGLFRRQDRRIYARRAYHGRTQVKSAGGLGPDLSAGASLYLRENAFNSVNGTRSYQQVSERSRRLTMN